MKNLQPIRMCIACRSRYPQQTLLRLRQVDKKIILSDGKGRSMYLCKECCCNDKKVKSLVKRFGQDPEHFVKLLKSHCV